MVFRILVPFAATLLVLSMPARADSIKAGKKGAKQAEQLFSGSEVSFDGTMLTFATAAATNPAGAFSGHLGAPLSTQQLSVMEWDMRIDFKPEISQKSAGHDFTDSLKAKTKDTDSLRAAVQTAQAQAATSVIPPPRDLTTCKGRGQDWMLDARGIKTQGRISEIAGGYLAFTKTGVTAPEQYRLGDEVVAVGLGVCD